MLELDKNELVFKFPEIHPEAELRVDFQRTFRIPDDGKTYPLPPGFGSFPVHHVDDFKDRVPVKWIERGGVMFPMYQSEALWLRFHPKSVYRRGTNGYVFAVRVAAGKVNAVSGEPWTIQVKEGDHMVCPPQPWLDGFCVEKGKIRQFVAMPLGWGLTAEAQVTGKEEHGGIQIEVIPMKASEFERRFPKESRRITRSKILLCDTCDSLDVDYERSCAVAAADMGLGAGGQMTQEIYADTYGLDVWDVPNRARSFIHLANSFSWEAITGHSPPPTPCTAEAYVKKGLPWFDHYLDGVPIQAGGENLKTLKSVLAMGWQKGLNIFPSNDSVKVPEKIVKIGDKRPEAAVRDGSW